MAKAAVPTRLLLNPISVAIAWTVALLRSWKGPEYTVDDALGVVPSRV